MTLAGEERLLAERASTEYRLLANRRVITSVGMNEDWIRDLVVVGPDSLDERLVALSVLDSSFDAPRADADPSDAQLLYYVDDRQPSRTSAAASTSSMSAGSSR
ncbi:hypothetical protein G6O69_17145 [Pseudenhygromyxa sp. WMMC2535]|uniref:hypothetical protein n=1 Tax=Pseudenhygromyxa sp. WMMC2535 TaxID=2712867 RepID=UPI001557A2A2|nr:hypothetical protein [Pseudenhygromyxa sp. WMMC2535]NVB39572.1 hypothetical protein [Pseudenhygromyxa sp. WMMC2535]